MDYRAAVIKPGAKIIVLGRVEYWEGSRNVFVASSLQSPPGCLLLTSEGWPDICVDENDVFDVTDESEHCLVCEATAETTNLRAENARLKAQLKRLVEIADKEKDGYVDQLNEAHAEIERLREETGREARAHDYTRDRLLAIIGELTSKGVFYQARAAAWKKAAKMWMMIASEFATSPESKLESDEFIIADRNGFEMIAKKAPSDWREKWLPAPTEGKSALDEKLGSSEP